MRISMLITCLSMAVLAGCALPPEKAAKASQEPVARQDHVAVALAHFAESQKEELKKIRTSTEETSLAVKELTSLMKSQPVAAPDPRTEQISRKLDDVLDTLESLLPKEPPPVSLIEPVDPPPAEPPVKEAPAAMTSEQFNEALDKLAAKTEDLERQLDEAQAKLDGAKAKLAPKAPAERAVIVNGEPVLLAPFLNQWYRSNSGFHAPAGKALSLHLTEHGVSAADVATLDYETQRRLHIALHEREARGGRVVERSRSTATYSAPPAMYAAPTQTYTRWVRQCVNGVCQMVPQIVQYQQPQRQATVEVRRRTKVRGGR